MSSTTVSDNFHCEHDPRDDDDHKMQARWDAISEIADHEFMASATDLADACCDMDPAPDIEVAHALIDAWKHVQSLDRSEMTRSDHAVFAVMRLWLSKPVLEAAAQRLDARASSFDDSERH